MKKKYNPNLSINENVTQLIGIIMKGGKDDRTKNLYDRVVFWKPSLAIDKSNNQALEYDSPMKNKEAIVIGINQNKIVTVGKVYDALTGAMMDIKANLDLLVLFPNNQEVYIDSDSVRRTDNDE